MKPIFQLTFLNLEDFKRVRDYTEGINPPATMQTGTKDGKSYIKFFNGTSPVLIWQVAQYCLTEKIVNVKVEGK